MGKSMVSCKFSLKPIYWIFFQIWMDINFSVNQYPVTSCDNVIQWIKTYHAQNLSSKSDDSLHNNRLYKVVPPFDSVQLVQITPITMVYRWYIYSIHGVNRNQFITFGGHHLVPTNQHMSIPGVYHDQHSCLTLPHGYRKKKKQANCI